MDGGSNSVDWGCSTQMDKWTWPTTSYISCSGFLDIPNQESSTSPEEKDSKDKEVDPIRMWFDSSIP